MTQVQKVERVAVRFAGDSGDGMQLTGDRFTADTAVVGSDFATLPNYPAEIRAPAGTLNGVSSFQVQFADYDIRTPGELVDVLVAMNPAALKSNLKDLAPGGTIIVDSGDFTNRNLTRVGYTANPIEDGSLSSYAVHALDLTGAAVAAVTPFGLNRKDASRTKNMYALGLVTWLFSRSPEGTLEFLATKFAKKPQLRDANVAAFNAGYNFGETAELFAVRYEVGPAPLPPGTYRQISGNKAIALGLVAGAVQAKLPLFLGAYPITPASDVLHELSTFKNQGVITFQCEDEIAAIGSALGASYAGSLGTTVTSGPGLALKMETLGLAVMLELPLVVVDVQRAGPSTGMPTKTEQADLLQSLFGRHGEAPIPVLAAQSPTDCFAVTVEATKIAVEYRTPVIILSDGYLANGAEPMLVPSVEDLPVIETNFATEPNGPDGTFLPYLRDAKGARPLAVPGTPGLEHRIGGIEKADRTGNISYDPANHDWMVRQRQAKVDGIAAHIPDVVVDDPSGEARLLVVSWGSSFGPVSGAARRVRRTGRKVAHVHLRHLNPFPANLGEILKSYDKVIVPEMNLGQLAFVLRAKYLVDAESYARVRGLPISITELSGDLMDALDHLEA